jgi:hypothetical protein
LAEQMIAFIRAFGLHRPEQTSRGEPVRASEAHALVILRRGAINHGQLARALQLQRSSVSRLSNSSQSAGGPRARWQIAIAAWCLSG